MYAKPWGDVFHQNRIFKQRLLYSIQTRGNNFWVFTLDWLVSKTKYQFKNQVSTRNYYYTIFIPGLLFLSNFSYSYYSNNSFNTVVHRVQRLWFNSRQEGMAWSGRSPNQQGKSIQHLNYIMFFSKAELISFFINYINQMHLNHLNTII